MVEELFDGPEAPGAGDPGAQRAVGRVLGIRETRVGRAWAEVRAEWRALEGTARFWK